jgi:hypothetical protein
MWEPFTEIAGQKHCRKREQKDYKTCSVQKRLEGLEKWSVWRGYGQ